MNTARNERRYYRDKHLFTTAAGAYQYYLYITESGGEGGQVFVSHLDTNRCQMWADTYRPGR